MRIESLTAGVLASACLLTGAVAGQQQRTVRLDRATVALEQRFFYRLDLGESLTQAEALLRRDPANSVALFVRMETAELEDRPDRVLDSALRLCGARAPADFQEVASNRILEHAANTQAFNAVLEQLEARARTGPCSLNLRLALVTAASDGARVLDLDHATNAAGLLTEWRIAGPFGRYTNVDMGRHWPPESDQLSLASYGQRAAEDFRFGDGQIALPDYLWGPGVFYAATEPTASRGGAFRLDVFAAGPYIAYVDGRPTLLHDSPYLDTRSRDSVWLRLQPGKHRVMLKFTSDSAPLRVVWHEETMTTTGLGSEAITRQPLHLYASILESYFRQDFASIETRLNSGMCRRAVACVYLRAMLQSASGRQSPRMAARWQALLKAEPAALLAELKIRQAAAELNEIDDEARQQATVVALNNPQSETAARLALKLSGPKPEEGERLILHLLQLHPSCAYLTQALEFDNLWGDLSHAQAAERQLDGCAPLSLDYARALAQTGRHSAAARALEKIVSANPLYRPARRLLVEELVLNRQPQLASEQARELHRIAPNAPSFLHLAEDPELAIDSNTPRAQGLAAKNDFYAPYRRDGLALIRNSPAPDAAVSAMTLLADRVIELGQDGSVSVYVHAIGRLLSKESLNACGEVSLPPGASILELRTVKGSGQTIEPELEFDTPSVAMPALDPGDSIEEEFVNRYSGWNQTPEDVFRFEFGSFVAPVIAARLVVITPAGSPISFSGQNGAPSVHSERAEGKTIQTWEREDIPAADAESFLPGGRLLPTVTMARTNDVGDRLRDQLISSTRAGPNVLEAAQALRLRLGPATGERARAKLLYSFVKQAVESDGSDWTTNSADDSLLKGRGSRTLALLALARLTGMRAGLVLARLIDHPCGQDLNLQCYSQPVVRFRMGREVADVDAEADDLPFGVVAPTLASSDALVVGTLATGDESVAEVASLAINRAVEKTRADGDLWLNGRGDLTARIQVRLGATRSQELRSQMRGDFGERQSFFEQFARRIFPDSVEITGSVLDEHDAEQSLEITVRCRVPQFVDLKGGVADIGQLAPALGLRGTFVRTATRRFPLYTESLFFESTLFRLHLPPGIELRSLPHDFATRSQFGDYALHFASTGRQIAIRREFRIPVQLIEPDKYPSFDVFARQIDDAERQQISLEASGYASSAPSSSKLRLPTNK